MTSASSSSSSDEPIPDPSDLQAEVDAVSLEQALIDFEVANARVVDLAHRLVEATNEIGRLQRELTALGADHAELESVHNQMRHSHAFKLAERIWTIRNALGI